MSKPLCIDLFCGLGGWTEGFLAEGYDVVGFDIERHQYGQQKYPAQLVIQDVLTLHGSQFRDAAVIVASPPCPEFSYRGRYGRTKNLAPPDLRPFQSCFRIAREAGKPCIVENVVFAQAFVGKANTHLGFVLFVGRCSATPTTSKTPRRNQRRSRWTSEPPSRFPITSREKKWTAEIAKIPFELSSHIARIFKPR